MLSNDLHRLLKRQLKKSRLDINDPNLSDFLTMVNAAYSSFDQDLVRLENILEESSKELFKANQSLKLESASTKAQLENIMNSVQGVLFQTDINGNFVYLNQAWEDLTGLKIKDSLGRNYSDIFIGKNDEERKRISQLFRRIRESYKTVFKYHTPDNKIKWVEINLVLSKDANKQIVGTIGTMNDITSLKETELELNEAHKLKDDFLSTVSHEIRTPLNAVVGLSNVLLMEEHLPEQLENLNALKYSGEHLLLLINDILDLNKIESGNIEFEEREFDLNELLRTIKYHFKLVSKRKKLEFRIEKDISVPNILVGDSIKLAQIIKNLLSNAFKFTEKGEVVLSIEDIGKQKGKHVLSFKVSDTGIGIPYEKQRHIFKKFTQAEKSTSRIYGGTGLGLAICKELLHLQNSDLQLVSEVDKGSTFWFNLNFKAGVSPQNSLADNNNLTVNNEALDIRVLVAEDNEINTLVLKKMLDKWNINYTMTKDGQELLDVYEKENFDLILMDLQMPVLDGYETTKAIRELKDTVKANIPIIALTAFSQNEIKDKTKAYKMDGYMTKPFGPKNLYQLLCFYDNKRRKRLIV